MLDSAIQTKPWIRPLRGGKLSATCRICHVESILVVGKAQLSEWLCGRLIQNVMPQLTSDERELMISGTCGECFDRMFEGL